MKEMCVGRLASYQSVAPRGGTNGVPRQMRCARRRVSSPLLRVSAGEPVERFRLQS